MRNLQLIRQWKILKLFADMPSEKIDIRYEELADVFGVSKKTIKRDLQGLQDAGFVDSWFVRRMDVDENGAFVKVRKEHETKDGRGMRRRFKRKDSLFPVLDYVERVGSVDAAPAKCNVCGYVFMVGVSGGVDMKDFRRHKSGHLVVGMKDKKKAEAGGAARRVKA